MRKQRAWLLCLLVLATGAGPKPSKSVSPPPREQEVSIPAAGTEHGLFTRICRPPGAGPFRVAVLNHGSPIGHVDPLLMLPAACTSEVASWFLGRGFMVVVPLRRGFGRTGGVIAETSGSCEKPDYVTAGLAGAADIRAAVAFATALPDARPDDAVVAGDSTGGWAIVAFNSTPHPRVGALISMAGGRGAWAFGQPGHNCRPDLLAQAAAQFAQTATTPMLWIYAENDTWFPPSVAQRMAQAYQQAGGKLKFVQTQPIGVDGHFMFSSPGGSRIWGDIVARYLSAQESGS